MTQPITRYGRLTAAVDDAAARTGLTREVLTAAFLGALTCHVDDPAWDACIAALNAYADVVEAAA